MEKEYSVKILNWEKYQTRAVKTRCSWLRLQNDFIENPNFYEFTSDERTVWIYAMCCASKLNSAIIQVPHQCSHRVLHRCTGIDENVFHRTFKKLKRLHIVEVRVRHGCYTDDTFAYADATLRNVTERYVDVTERNGTKDSCSIASNEFDFESLYKKYPRKEGKQEGLKHCKREIKTLEAFKSLSSAIDAYAAHQQKLGTEGKYIKLFSSFMTSWKEWTDPQTGTVAAAPPVDYSYLDKL